MDVDVGARSYENVVDAGADETLAVVSDLVRKVMVACNCYA
jgi:hypothetical protein